MPADRNDWLGLGLVAPAGGAGARPDERPGGNSATNSASHFPTGSRLWPNRTRRASNFTSTTPRNKPFGSIGAPKESSPPEERVYDENRPAETSGGSTVEVKLQPVDAKAAQAVISPAEATVLEYVDMPKPRLVKLAAGGDYEETSIVHLQPALAEGEKPIWGAYRLAVVYGASFSNAEEFQRNLRATLWQGEVTSNTIALELRPALPDSLGVLGGSTLGQDLQPRAGIRVSLSDRARAVDRSANHRARRTIFLCPLAPGPLLGYRAPRGCHRGYRDLSS